MHTNLKGRIFNRGGTSYLVLQERSESPQWLRVRALNQSREVSEMRIEEVQRFFPGIAATNS